MTLPLELDVQAPQDKSQNEDIYSKLGKMIAEILGTGTLMFVGCMGCIGADESLGSTMVASLSFGLAITMAIQLYAHISGAHFNACVTVAAVILGKIDIPLAILYIISQIVGALLGYGLLMLVTNEEYNKGVCVTVINPNINILQAIIIEFMATGFLVSTCCAIWDERQSKYMDSLPLRFGLILGSVFVAAAKFTGAGMNPARSLAPAIFQNVWKDHWVYWLAPLLGATVTAIFYRYTFVEGLAKAGRKK